MQVLSPAYIYLQESKKNNLIHASFTCMPQSSLIKTNLHYAGVITCISLSSRIKKKQNQSTPCRCYQMHAPIFNYTPFTPYKGHLLHKQPMSSAFAIFLKVNQSIRDTYIKLN